MKYLALGCGERDFKVNFELIKNVKANEKIRREFCLCCENFKTNVKTFYFNLIKKANLKRLPFLFSFSWPICKGIKLIL